MIHVIKMKGKVFQHAPHAWKRLWKGLQPYTKFDYDGHGKRLVIF